MAPHRNGGRTGGPAESRTNALSAWSGILPVFKPPGYTSSEIVQVVKRHMAQFAGPADKPAGRRGRRDAIKVGHGGTLDPMAVGVLVCALGSSTKQLARLLESPKEYIVRCAFGSTTTTDDAEGDETAAAPAERLAKLERAHVEAALGSFRGQIMQTPPIYSALRVNGRRLYDYARGGEQVAISARPVTIHSLELLEFDASNSTAVLRVECSSGTYVRSLVRDLGAGILIDGEPVLAHMAALLRTRQGPFHSSDCLELSASLLQGAQKLDTPAKTSAAAPMSLVDFSGGLSPPADDQQWNVETVLSDRIAEFTRQFSTYATTPLIPATPVTPAKALNAEEADIDLGI